MRSKAYIHVRDKYDANDTRWTEREVELGEESEKVRQQKIMRSDGIGEESRDCGLRGVQRTNSCGTRRCRRNIGGVTG
ncbi:hypothetical protein SAMN03084138_02108 [Enterovibrio norvegicus DSM 15893]|uniref:Uncharacterized protein n=1 Tax=Enterovibrio norvegicus DSM 15893 TaxID=1121869 RepID=A0A1I5Q3M8_9GAMM|nr:hypothetical protein SAMN03084138_02108 [Enterovibrio norvegicus DSM 15893]